MVEAIPKLHAYKNSNNLLKILVVCKLTGYAVEIVEQPETLYPAETVSGSDTNTYPYLETSEGKVSETSAIIQYIADSKGFGGSSNYERALINQWTFFTTQDINYLARDLIYPIYGFLASNEESHKKSDNRLKALLKCLNNFLNGKTFLVGSKYSTADIELFFALRPYWQLYLIDQYRTKAFPNIEKWFTTLANHDAVKGVIGRVFTCKAPFKAIKKEEKPAPKKEEAKPAPKQEEAKPELSAKDKEKLFPESALNFDAFKYEFMNSTDRKAVLENFFNKDYDAKAFSVYYIRYEKLESEGKVLFVTENGRDGFLERAEQGRKHVFANLGIYGEEGNLEIKGVWLWRGKGIPFFMEEHPQFEYYERVELDPSKPEDRERIFNYWLTTTGDVVEGLKTSSNTLFR